MNKSENIFKKLKFDGISKKEHDQTVKIFKELDRDYKAVFKKEPIAFNPFQGIKIHKSASKRSKRKSNQKKKTMKGGSWLYIAMAIAVGCLAKAIFQNREREQDRYHGRVPEEFQGRRAYPPSYQPSGNFQSYHNTAPGHSDPHRRLYYDNYAGRDDMAANYDNEHRIDEMDRAVREEEQRDRDTMQRGVDGFNRALQHRRHIRRDGGEFDRATQLFMRPVIRNQAQQAWDDGLSQAPGAAGSHFGGDYGGSDPGVRAEERRTDRSGGNVAAASDNLFGPSESGYN